MVMLRNISQRQVLSGWRTYECMNEILYYRSHSFVSMCFVGKYAYCRSTVGWAVYKFHKEIKKQTNNCGLGSDPLILVRSKIKLYVKERRNCMSS